MKNELLIAVTQMAAERNLPKEAVLPIIESALSMAFKKDIPETPNLTVKINPATGDIRTFIQKAVVAEKPENPAIELTVAQAQRYKQGAKAGDIIELETNTPNTGRISIQTFKQVVLQKLKEVERERTYEEFSSKDNDIVSGVIRKIEPRHIVVDLLGKAEAFLPTAEQVPTERYRTEQRLKFYILEVQKTPRGPEIIVSRTHKNLIKRLFELEVPEIYNGLVEIKAIAREPGQRSKVAVTARQEGIDAVGSCVGLRGLRIQNIVNELQGEKLDVVQWHKESQVFIAYSLSPAQAMRVELNEVEKTATVVVADRQLSQAIGKEGINAKLAAKLTGWRIDIKSASEMETARAQAAATAVAEAPAVEAEEAVKTPAAPAEPADVTAAAPEPILAEAQLIVEEPAPPKEIEEEAPPQETAVDLDALLARAAAQAKGTLRFAEDHLVPSRENGGKSGGRGKPSRREKGKKEEGKVKRARKVHPQEEEDIEELLE